MTHLNLEDFRKPIFYETDNHFSYESGFNVNYTRIPLLFQNQRFTGSTMSQEGDTCRIIEYADGLMEGKNCLFSKEKLISEVFYNNGFELHGKTWHENGKEEFVWERYTTQTWDKEGTLIYEKYVEPDTEASEEFFYFKNGSVKFKQFTNLQICVKEYYSPNQELLITQKVYFHTSPITDEVVYNHDALQEWYFEILRYEHEGVDMEYFPNEVNGRMHLIWMWFWDIFKMSNTSFFEILINLLQHPQKSVVDTCVQIIAYHRFLDGILHIYHKKMSASVDVESIFDQIKAQQKLMDESKPHRETKPYKIG
jgi:antitoxin component YwqK of YwqJK toxin-antitoxin module